MSRQAQYLLIGLVVIGAAVGLMLFFTRRADAAAARPPGRMPPPPGEPPAPPAPLFPLLPPGQEKTATVQTSQGPITLVQKHDTSGLQNLLAKPTALPPGTLTKGATLKPGLTVKRL